MSFGLHSIELLLIQKLRGLSRQRPSWMLNIAIEEVSLLDGLRAACASTLMLLLGILLGRPDFAWAAIGAFWTCLAESPGTSRERLASMLSFSTASALCGGITAYAAALGTLASAVAIFAFATLAGLVRMWGIASYQVAILAATTCVVMVDSPLHDLHRAATFIGIYFGGCLFATALSLAAWRIHYHSPSRYALRLTYFRLSELATDGARLIGSEVKDMQAWAVHASELRARTRSAIEGARRALKSLPRRSAVKNGEVDKALRLALADAEMAFASLIAVAHVEEESLPTILHTLRAARCLSAIAAILQDIGQQIGDSNVAHPYTLRKRLSRFSRRLEAAFGNTLALPFQAAPSADGLPQIELDWLDTGTATIRRSLRMLRDHSSIYTPSVQFSLRLGTAATLVFLIVRALHLPFGYWATMATLLILQPSVATTWPRSVERGVGSILGAILAIAIGCAVHTPLAISLAVFPLICLTMALRPASYSLYVVFLTPSFVLVADYAMPSSELAYAIARLGNNILGSVIAVLATYLLWPNREAKNLQMALVDAVRANLAYLAIALAQRSARKDEHCASLQRRAGLASNRAEHLYRLSRLEARRHDKAFVKMADVFPLLRRIAGTAAKIQARKVTPEATVELATWVEAADDSLYSYLRGEHPLIQLQPFLIDEASPVDAVVIEQVHRLSCLLGVATELGKNRTLRL
ncbi:FUSC family protein [Herbaspirillum sp. DW155]|uniref:FUSC family protein n=1 Tax=Herbaspirillum sp. DW155 TaxID=3095609 RepID=UPI00308877E8|nr:FUSC family protein [Herbaspirillum sp. DW155]